MSLRGSRVATPTLTQADEFLMVMCGSTQYAVPADAVRAIVRPDDSEVAHILTTFGVDVVPSHLSEQFGLPGSYLSPDSRLLVCQREDDPSDRHVAFQVDGVLGLQEFDVSTMKPLPSQFTGSERQWFAGVFPVEQTVALVVNMRWLLSPNRLWSAPSESSATFAATRESSTAEATTAWNLIEVEEASDADDAPWAEI